ncbi:MAG: cytochrome ubiquinol oxidase subunit I [Pirellulaceae bacterium]
MNYPVWDVPHLGSGLVIALIAIFHIMIAHFAVGGGLFLPLAEAWALKNNRRDWLEFLPRHSKFFLVLTGVFGAVSGVGIWFSIGLASPEGTSTLIHNFVFGLAIEWVFFVIELTTAVVYYYTWGRIPDKLHLKVGWLYAASSFATLVIINGILTFMLTPGQSWLSVAGTGREPGMFVWAFFNPTYWPSLALRTLSCIALAGIWALVTGSRIDGATEPQLKREWIRWSTGWLIPGFVLMPICLWWYIQFIPPQQLQLSQLGISTIGAGTFTQVTRMLLVSVMASATILAVVYLAAYRKPEQFQLGYAIAVLLLGVAATGSAEMSRELLRKPYVVVDYMYSNGIRSVAIDRDGQAIREVDRFNDRGYLANSIWVREGERAAWNNESTSAGERAGTPDTATLARGELMFRGQCMACHTTSGYRSIRVLLRARNEQAIRNIVVMLHKHEENSPYRAFMPPLVGTQAERDALAIYLNHMVHGSANVALANQ